MRQVLRGLPDHRRGRHRRREAARGDRGRARYRAHGRGTRGFAPVGEPPDVVFYTDCNVLKTPHIALLALDIMDALGVSYRVMGGPSHCCGVVQMRTGDLDTSGRVGENTLDKLARSKSGLVLAWCPSCLV